MTPTDPYDDAKRRYSEENERNRPEARRKRLDVDLEQCSAAIAALLAKHSNALSADGIAFSIANEACGGSYVGERNILWMHSVQSKSMIPAAPSDRLYIPHVEIYGAKVTTHWQNVYAEPKYLIGGKIAKVRKLRVEEDESGYIYHWSDFCFASTHGQNRSGERRSNEVDKVLKLILNEAAYRVAKKPDDPMSPSLW